LHELKGIILHLIHYLLLKKSDLLKFSTVVVTFLYLIGNKRNVSDSSIVIADGATAQMAGVVYQLVKESGTLGI